LKGAGLDLDRDVITSEKGLENIWTKVQDDERNELDEALRKYRSSEFGNIPKWFWIVLLFFGYDDILRWLSNPIFFYPLTLILSLFGFCVITGHSDVPKNIFGGLWTVIRIFLGDKLEKVGIKV